METKGLDISVEQTELKIMSLMVGKDFILSVAQ